MVYFDDFKVGDTREYGSHTVTREEIVAFARQFDPQPFHVDERLAAETTFGGLIASGWHTTAICHRLTVDAFQRHLLSGSLGSPGAEEIRWLRPVRPGDTLSVASEVVEVRVSRSKPDRGIVRVLYTVRNQSREVVMTMLGVSLFRRRPAGA